MSNNIVLTMPTNLQMGMGSNTITLSMPAINMPDFTTLSTEVRCYQDLSNGDPSPTNLCTILYTQNCEITNSCKNIAQIELDPHGTGVTFTENADGSIHVEGTPASNDICGTADPDAPISYATSPIVLPKGTYTVSANGLSKSASEVAVYFFVVNTYDSYEIYQFDKDTTEITLTIRLNPDEPAHGMFIIVCFPGAYSVNDDIYLQVERGPSATAYEKNTGIFNVYDDISTGDARYGGTLNLLTGDVVKTHSSTSFRGGSDEQWSKLSSSNVFYIKVDDMLIAGADGSYVDNMWCDKLKTYPLRTDLGNDVVGISGATTTQTGYIYVSNNSASTTVEEFKSWLVYHNLQVVYPLATPVTGQVTPVQIPLVPGASQIYSSTGDITVTLNGTTQTGESVAINVTPTTANNIVLKMPD